jgi:peptidyl-prolyl cis-trans isomerase D
MFDFVRRHNRLLQLGLALVIFPSFIAFGIQGYQSFNGESEAVAHVDGQAIMKPEWDAAHLQQIERVRAQMPDVDPKLLDSPVVRQQVLEDLVRQRVALAAARKLLLTPTDQRLQRLFVSDPQFASLRNADGSVRKEFLEARGMSSEGFAQQLRQDMATRQVAMGMAGSVVAPKSIVAGAMDAYFQRRDIQIAIFSSKDYLAKVSATDDELKAYYDDPKRGTSFQSPESVAIEYVVLDLPSVSRSLNVSEDDLRKYYDDNGTRFQQPEERRTRHILVKVETGAAADVKAKARAKADGLLTELRKNRGAFADLARKQSDDPGSAQQGGDLDWVSRGAMVKPFEDAVFAAKKGDLSEVVESEFGFHLIEVTDVRGGEKQPFPKVRGEIEAEVKKQQAQKRYAELAEQFTNLVDQEETLKPVADKLKLAWHEVKGLGRTPKPGAAPELASAKLLDALFQSQALTSHRNLEPIDIGGSQLVAARVIEHAPARKQPLAEIVDKVRAAMLNEKASLAATEDGKARLADWQAKPDGAKLGNVLTVSRSQMQGQSRELVAAALKAQADTLPAWGGVSLGAQGYAVIKLVKVMPADAAADSEAARAGGQYAQLWGQAESQAYYTALSKRFKAEVTPAKLKAADAAGTAP